MTFFTELVNSRKTPFPELRHYILAIQEAADGKIIFVPKQDSVRTTIKEHSGLQEQRDKYEFILEKKISIPVSSLDWKISILPISSQLIKKIENSGCGKLYDLQGVKYEKFFKLKSFEKSDVIQLYAFITQLQSKKTYPSIEAIVAKSFPAEKTEETTATLLKIINEEKINHDSQTLDSDTLERTGKPKYKSTETISIPRSLVKFPLQDLSPSDNLGKLLKKAKLYKIGHLRGLTYYDLEHRLDFTSEEMAELQNLMEFAKQHAKYTMFKTGFETIKKAALKRKKII